MTATILSISDINTSINHEPRMLDVKLAEALGFARPRKIRDVISRHLEALQQLGEVVCPTVGQTSKGGRPGKEYWLTKKQALYLCTKSETPNATEVTIQMVEVFDQVTNNASVAVRAHTRRKPSRSVAQPMRPVADVAAAIPLEDCLISSHAHMERAQRHYGTAQGARELDTALACLTRFKDEFERPVSFLSLYRSKARSTERRKA
ncbi:hypothetical protein [uncultured Cohaesibacter sp.]|uniref:hypothetical protein n=1 Tax=uncultured Cohaesibacter sp. TaxID=1002546 RepID=UPI0029C7D451|nr:hypothetical protein [uncultured Cohaesibacter sp.]